MGAAFSIYHFPFLIFHLVALAEATITEPGAKRLQQTVDLRCLMILVGHRAAFSIYHFPFGGTCRAPITEPGAKRLQQPGDDAQLETVATLLVL